MQVDSYKLRWRIEIRKQRFLSENASNVFRHTTLEKLKNAAITDHFGFEFEENSCREIT